ncbi:hypothetical protein GDO81_016403 [Engystomops pustulosus]|uniref:Uncharacterized protein n=1 Tax=Engystomops pustulosus TaxID=76066 RepID=A0AAV7ASQ4_ENGPU|nr:hypothetical protein GDO81_016403 [Engystomops pustulosus]
MTAHELLVIAEEAWTDSTGMEECMKGCRTRCSRMFPLPPLLLPPLQDLLQVLLKSQLQALLKSPLQDLLQVLLKSQLQALLKSPLQDLLQVLLKSQLQALLKSPLQMCPSLTPRPGSSRRHQASCRSAAIDQKMVNLME